MCWQLFHFLSYDRHFVDAEVKLREVCFSKSHSCAWRGWDRCTLSSLTNVLLEKLFPAEILDLLFVADSFQALQFCALRWILSVGKNMVTLETRSLEQQSNYSTITRVY